METNPGVTGLNYQYLKKGMFPDISYEELDEAVDKRERYACTASFSSLMFAQKKSLKRGGFVMPAPLGAECDRVDLAWAVVADIACSIYIQYQSLCSMIKNKNNYILGCGGGLQSKVLCQMLADLTQKELVIQEGFSQATLAGGAEICSEYFGVKAGQKQKRKIRYRPKENRLIKEYLVEWQQNRTMLNSR